MTIEKMMLVMVHIQGELALVALHPEKQTEGYCRHISEELREVATELETSPKAPGEAPGF